MRESRYLLVYDRDREGEWWSIFDKVTGKIVSADYVNKYVAVTELDRLEELESDRLGV